MNQILHISIMQPTPPSTKKFHRSYLLLYAILINTMNDDFIFPPIFLSVSSPP